MSKTSTYSARVKTVDGTFTVMINMSNTQSYPNATCTCRAEGYCEHEAALMQLLIRPSTSFLDINKELHELPAMESIGADSWRPIPNISRADQVETVISSLAQHENYKQYELHSTWSVINSDDTYTLHVRLTGIRYGYPDREMATEVKKTHGQLFTRCLVCDAMTDKLCTHQSLLFTIDDYSFLKSLIDDEIPTYTDLVEIAASSLKLKPEQVEKYFTFEISEDTINYRPKQNLLIGENIEDDLEYKTERVEHPDLEVEVTRMKNMCYAFLWEERTMEALAGKTNKSQTKLTSGINRVGRKEIIDGRFRNIISELKYLASNSPRAFLEYCQKHINYLAANINYIEDPRGYRRKVDMTLIDLQKKLLKIRVHVFRDGKITIIRGEAIVNKKTIPLSEIKYLFRHIVVVESNKAYIFKSPFGHILLELFCEHDGELAMLEDGSNLKALYDVINQADEVIKEGFEKSVLSGGKKKLFIEKMDNFLTFVPKLVYDEEEFHILESDEIKNIEENVHFAASTTEFTKFSAQINELFAPIKIDTPHHRMILVPEREMAKETTFLPFIRYCTNHDIEILGDEAIFLTKFSTKRPKMSVSFNPDIDWFGTTIELFLGKARLPAKRWIEATKKNKKYVQLDNGKFGILPEEWLDKLKRLALVGEVKKDGTVQIHNLRFNVLDEWFEHVEDEYSIEDINRKREALANYENNKNYALPKNLQATLRPYQVQGYQWLKFLEEFNFGGCLADDMGLGKTLQVLALLLDQQQANKGTSLVVVPRSLLFNWASEIEKFTPTLKFIIHHGTHRAEEFKDFDENDLIITTYDTCVRDANMLVTHEFNYVILDESQAIKNPHSQRYKAMRMLKARNRLVMTGTPIENNTVDLYAQMSFVNPGLLSTLANFKAHFARQIDVKGNEEVAETLRNIIHPFILRRTKEHVAKELPEKIETILYCEMGEVQRAMYEELKKTIQIEVSRSIKLNGIKKSKFQVMQGLLRLRQFCNATQLANQNLPKAKRKSAKIDFLIPQLTSLGNHKVLVFSQFVGMLALIREQLDELGLRYAYLDGQTQNRKKAVDTFKNDPACKIFLISIKAGNTGLNLTEADYVYIIDPWWNPAVEAQAIDRTHRIGQDKPIFAYKVICKDSVEEQIIQLQQKKKAVANDIIQLDETIFKSLNKNELLALFE